MMTRDLMILLIKEQTGYSQAWKDSLDKMTDSQIVAIFMRMKKKGIIK